MQLAIQIDFSLLILYEDRDRVILDNRGIFK